jgi:hypothetical protein
VYHQGSGCIPLEAGALVSEANFMSCDGNSQLEMLPGTRSALKLLVSLFPLRVRNGNNDRHNGANGCIFQKKPVSSLKPDRLLSATSGHLSA